ncbi:MAG: tetratricopeptide repeat protein [Bacteroidetes bacterium]|nr:tetratricopeptide repeat protein [Bacteroidota bacterium]
MKKISYFLLFFSVYILPAQTVSPADSLLKLLSFAKTDSVRARILSQLTEVCDIPEITGYAREVIKLSDKYSSSPDLKTRNKFIAYKATATNNMAFVADAEGNVDKCVDLYKQALRLREEIKDTNAIGNTLFNLGSLYKSTGRTDEAFAVFHKALKFLRLKKNKMGMSKCYFALGEFYLGRGKISESISCLDSSLKISTEINDRSSIASALTGLGTIQGELGDTKKELEYLNRCLKIQEELNDPFGLSFTYNNLGFVYNSFNDHLKAKECYEKSRQYAEAVNEWAAVARADNNLANICYELKDTVRALELYKKSIEIYDKIKDETGKSMTLINLGKIKFYQGKISEGRKYLEQAHEMGSRIGFAEALRKSSEVLSSLYAGENNYKQAYLMHREFKQLSDSMFSRENKKASYKHQVKLEFEKKETETKLIESAKREKIEALANEKQKRSAIIITAISLGLVLMGLLAVFIFRGYRQKQKANTLLEEKNILIEQQKELVEEKQKEILDSIHYAKRIQSAILASEEDIKQHFENSFLFYKPKDIVAGDFYFYEATATHAFYAAADCTGHGVPGALVSVVCSNALTRCVNEFRLADPGKILDKARELVLDTLKKSGENVKDGMDISLLAKDLSKNKYSWAGANNPLWYIKGIEDARRLEEIVANKQPIGLTENPLPFKTHELAVSPGDIVFLFTDGYADQFGGPKGKKFKYKQLEELLIKNAGHPLISQKENLSQAFDDWKGELEQVDDVCIIGILIA